MPPEDDKPKLDQLIDANLRKVYDQVLNEDVPDRFVDLLRQLREADERKATAPDDSDEETGNA